MECRKKDVSNKQLNCWTVIINKKMVISKGETPIQTNCIQCQKITKTHEKQFKGEQFLQWITERIEEKGQIVRKTSPLENERLNDKNIINQKSSK